MLNRTPAGSRYADFGRPARFRSPSARHADGRAVLGEVASSKNDSRIGTRTIVRGGLNATATLILGDRDITQRLSAVAPRDLVGVVQYVRLGRWSSPKPSMPSNFIASGSL